MSFSLVPPSTSKTEGYEVNVQWESSCNVIINVVINNPLLIMSEIVVACVSTSRTTFFQPRN